MAREHRRRSAGDRGADTEATGESGDGVSLSRRNYMTLAGTAAASTLGYLGATGQAAAASPSVAAYSYGGTPMLEQSTLEETEPNGRSDDATRIQSGVGVLGTLESDEIDWFTFDASKGDDLRATFDREKGTGVSVVILHGRNQQYLNRTYVDSDAPSEVTAAARYSGAHYVQVLDIQNGDGDYTLTVRAGSESTDSNLEEYGVQGYGDYGYGR